MSLQVQQKQNLVHFSTMEKRPPLYVLPLKRWATPNLPHQCRLTTALLLASPMQQSNNIGPKALTCASIGSVTVPNRASFSSTGNVEPTTTLITSPSIIPQLITELSALNTYNHLSSKIYCEGVLIPDSGLPLTLSLKGTINLTGLDSTQTGLNSVQS